MDLIYAMRDLGVVDPAADTTGEETIRAELAQELIRAALAQEIASSLAEAPAERRRARQRQPRLRIRTTVPAVAMAAAGVAALAIAIASGGSPGHATPPAGSNASQGQETAYVIRRVRAAVAATGNDVVKTVETGGNGNPGTDRVVTTWAYTDPQTKVQYTASRMAMPDGTAVYAQYIVGTPAGNGVSWQSTNLDPQQNLYAQTTDLGPQSEGDSNAADAQSIEQELNNGQATEDGTTTLNGQQVIRLTVPALNGWTNTLYVDAQSYQPLESSSVQDGAPHGTTTETWLSPTAANIANAKLAQLPSGFSEVSQSALEQANPQGR